MIEPDGLALPTTFTPVFDASNRWAATRVNFSSRTQLNPGLLDVLFPETSEESEDATNVQLPLLIEAEDPRQWEQLLAEAPTARRLHLLFPAACFADSELQPALAALGGRAVTLVARGIPEEHWDLHAVALDVKRGINGRGGILLRRLKGPHLAFGIDSPASHREAMRAGFQWFEGDGLLQPDVEHGYHASTSRSTLLNLLGLVASDADSHEIEGLLKRDANLSYQLLKLVNSVSFSLTQKISSFNQAITLLGRRQLQRWLQLLMFAGQNSKGDISPLFCIAAHRAALMEALVDCRGGKQGEKDSAFMVGLFSLLDALFNAPIADLVTPLNLEDRITVALVAHEGSLGHLLELAIAAESEPGEALAQGLAELAISPDLFARAQYKAIAWALRICREF